jgi:phenylacetate-coenzyme A ligase PaaK-like adenylate-forming protein
MLTLPGGAQRWPSFPSSKWSHVAPVRQVQLVQKSTERIVVRVVTGRALTVGEEQEFLAALAGCLGHPFAMELERVDEIPRSASHKFEDFISEVI